MSCSSQVPEFGRVLCSSQVPEFGRVLCSSQVPEFGRVLCSSQVPETQIAQPAPLPKPFHQIPASLEPLEPAASVRAPGCPFTAQVPLGSNIDKYFPPEIFNSLARACCHTSMPWRRSFRRIPEIPARTIIVKHKAAQLGAGEKDCRTALRPLPNK